MLECVAVNVLGHARDPPALRWVALLFPTSEAFHSVYIIWFLLTIREKKCNDGLCHLSD